MSVPVNQASIQAAKLNLQSNQGSTKASNVSASNSSFFSILQSMVGGNTVKPKDNANNFSDFSKNADALRDRMQSLQSKFKNNSLDVSKDTTVTRKTEDKISEAPLEASGSGKNHEKTIKKVAEVAEKAVILPETENSDAVVDNTENIKIDITLILQLLGVSPDILNLLEQQGGDANIAAVAGLNQLSANLNEAVLGINIDGGSTVANVNGLTVSSGADNVNASANVFENILYAASNATAVAATVVNANAYADSNVGAVIDANSDVYTGSDIDVNASARISNLANPANLTNILLGEDISISADTLQQGSVLINLGDAAKVLEDISEMSVIPQEGRQIISDLAAKFANMANVNIQGHAVIAETNQNPDAVDYSLGAFKENIVKTIVETVTNVSNAPVNFAQGMTSASDVRTVSDVQQKLSALLKANGIDAQDILREASVRVAAATDGEQIQNIRDILSAMKNSAAGNTVVKDEQTLDSSMLENFRSTHFGTRGQINTASLISQNIRTDAQRENPNLQPEVLSQTAIQIRQTSLAGLNNTLEANLQNTNAVSDFGNSSINSSSTEADEFTNALTGVVDARSVSQQTANVTARQQTQIIELRTHVANAANEISNIIAKNRTGGNFEMKLKLVPEGLGEVLIKVTYNRGNINLNIVAENRVAESQLLNQVETLKESLASHDFNLTGFDVSTGSGFGDNYNRNQRNGDNGGTFANYFNRQQQSDGEDISNTLQNMQKLSNLYMNRVVYKTI